MSDQKTDIPSKANHLEKIFDLPEGSTEKSKLIIADDESKDIIEYDEKDKEIEYQFQQIKDMAQYTFEKIQDQIEDVEPKYSARLHEVSSTFLNTMLDAAKSKAKIKSDKDKLAKRSSSKVQHTHNNTIISTTTDIINELRNKNKVDTIEGDFEIKDKPNE